MQWRKSLQVDMASEHLRAWLAAEKPSISEEEVIVGKLPVGPRVVSVAVM